MEDATDPEIHALEGTTSPVLRERADAHYQTGFGGLDRSPEGAVADLEERFTFR